jgi:NRAMP (natural resistance-associated macrophage protein)-like metal ion transporter
LGVRERVGGVLSDPGQGDRRRSVRGWAHEHWSELGPGLITGASDNDPSGITTYSVAGASTGYGLLWMALFTVPLLIAVQSMAARIGAVKREGLGKVIEDRFGRPLLIASIVVLLVANTATIAADLGGVAAGVNLLIPVPVGTVIPVVGAGLLAVEVFWSYRRFATVIKWLTLVLLLYIVSGLIAHPHLESILRGTFVPHLSLQPDFINSVVAILGTTISPYMFFWISSQESEERDSQDAATREPRTRDFSPTDERAMRRDVVVGMGYANVVFYFIVLANAATLGARHIPVTTAAQAAKALTPIVGAADTVLFAVGLIGAGLIAVPVLAGSAAYPLAELFGWREGLNQPLRRAPGFYAVIAVAVTVGVAGNYLGIDPVKGLVYAAVLQGVLAPVLLLLLTVLARDPEVMGEHRNKAFDSIFGFAAVAVMATAAAALLLVTVFG